MLNLSSKNGSYVCNRFTPHSSRVRCLFRRTVSQEAQSKHLKAINELPGPDKDLGKIAFASKYAGKFGRLLRSQFGDKPVGSVALNSQLREVQKYGNIYKTNILGLRPAVNVKISSPADVATVFRSESRFPVRSESPVQKYYREKKKMLPGILFNSGEEWYKLRHLTDKKLLRPRVVPNYTPMLNEVASDFLARLNKIKGSAGRPNEIPDLQNELFRWSFESVTRLLFDRRFGSLEFEMNLEAQEFTTAVQQFLDSGAHIEVFPLWFYKIFPTSMYRQFTRSTDQLNRSIELFISRKLKELEHEGDLEVGKEERVGFFHFLLTRDLSKDDLVATMVDLLVAGVDTTATTIQWSLYLLARHPEKQEKLYQEVCMAVKDGDVPSHESLSDMPYLKACIKETMRLYPLAFIQRVLPEDTVLGRYHIPAGTSIMILLYAMGQNPDFFANPTAFEPERWLRSPQQTGGNVEPFTYLPFGFGRRMCPGRRIADLQMSLLLVRIVQNFVLRHASEEEVERSLHGFIIIPACPIQIELVDRIWQK